MLTLLPPPSPVPFQAPVSAYDRRQRGIELAVRHAKLSEAEWQELQGLGRDAMPGILGAMAKFTIQGRSVDSFYRMALVLEKVVVPSDTRLLLGSLPEMEPFFSRSRLLEILAAKGDPTLMTPAYIRILENPEEEDEMGRLRPTAVEGLADSLQPAAQRFWLRKLHDPKDPRLQRAAYASIARRSTRDVRRELLAMRKQDRTLPPLAERMGLDRLPATPRENAWALKAVHGEYGLVTSNVLGGYDDLFLVRRKEGRWTKPLFTGVGKIGRFGVEPKAYEASELEYERLRKHWVEAFIGNPKLTVDTDGDGLNDLAEERLGTDPKLADSDSDGLSDLIDKNPLAAPRELTDDEAVIVTAYEAKNHFSSGFGVDLVSFPGTPFELPSADGYVIPRATAGTVKEMYGEGPIFVNFNPRKSASGSEAGGEMRFPKNSRQVPINVYQGPKGGYGCIMSLRKFDGVWFVIGNRRTWVA